MRISTSSWNLTANSIQHHHQSMDSRRVSREKDRGGVTTPVDPLDLVPAVADRIKAFEDLIRRSNRFETNHDDDENNIRKKRSQSCPARNGMSIHSTDNSSNRSLQTFHQGMHPQKQLLRRTGLLDNGNGRNGSHLSLFNCGSTTSSSGYTSTTPPSPEPELSPNRYIFLTAQPAISGRFNKEGDEEEEEDKQIELEIFSRHPSNESDRLFSATSSDDEVDVDEEDIDDIRWSDLESEMDLDEVVDILIQSKTSNEVRNNRRGICIWETIHLKIK